MSKLMQKYVTVCLRCQQLFYEIIATNESYHKDRMKFIRRFYGMSLMFAYLRRFVNDFRRFYARNTGLWISGAVDVKRLSYQSTCLTCMPRGSNHLPLEFPRIGAVKFRSVLRLCKTNDTLF